MFQEIWKDIRYQIRTGNIWTRVIVLCVIVFLIVNLLKSYFTFTNGGIPSEEYRSILEKISISSYWWNNIKFPWVWLTHIFVHEGFFHLLWNMIFLYWVSQIVDDLIGKNHSVYIFFEGAIVGGLFFLLSTMLLPWYSSSFSNIAFGASAAVTALLFAAATIAPDYNIRLLIIGNISLKYVALAILLLDLLFAFQNSNSGGHFAHIGGAFMGWLYIYLLRSGVKMNFLQNFSFEPKPKPKKTIVRRMPPREIPKQKIEILEEDELDRILDKIKSKGIQSLSASEKEFLDRKSK